MTNTQQKTKPLQKIAILGGGTAGWMAVSLMQKAWPRTHITLIESEDIGVIGVGEGSTPSLRDFFKRLNILESEWMPACNATYKCGISFPGWSVNKGFEGYFHPFFSQLDLPTGNAFMHNACLRRRGMNVPAHPDDFWVSAQLAEQQRSPKLPASSNVEPDYGYHFDSGLLGQFLKSRAIKLGMIHMLDTVLEVEQGEDGSVVSLQTQSHGKVAADFFVDCTGFAGVLINKALNVPFQSYGDYLFNDRAVAIASSIDTSESVPSQTVSEALKCGWAWKIPLVNRFGNGYVYSSKYLTDAEAEAELREHIGPSCEGMQARHLKMRVGRVEQHWCKNVLAVGLSQGFIEPLEATALMLVQFTIENFIRDYDQTCSGAELAQQRDEFNNKVNANFEGIKDYIVAHYRSNSRLDSQYWIDNRENLRVSPRLQTIFDAWDKGLDFEATLTQFKGELNYLRPSWYCLLAGMGRFPKALFPAPAEQRVAPVDEARLYCQQVAEKFQVHRENLQETYGEQWIAIS